MLQWNLTNPTTGIATQQLILFVLLLAVLLVRVGALEDRGALARDVDLAAQHLRVQTVYTGPSEDARSARPGSGSASSWSSRSCRSIVSTGQSFIISQMCAYAVIALSLTVLTGWGGQVSLGQFGLVAVGADITCAPRVERAAHPAAPARRARHRSGRSGRRVCRRCGYEGSTSRSALSDSPVFMQTSVLATSCVTLPLIHRTVCTGLPNPGSTLIIEADALRNPDLLRAGVRVVLADRSRAFGAHGPGLAGQGHRQASDRGPRQRDRRGIGRHTGGADEASRLRAVGIHGRLRRGHVRVTAPSGSRPTTFDPTFSILVVSMVVIGGLDSITGALLGAIYLIGLPAIFGATPTSSSSRAASGCSRSSSTCRAGWLSSSTGSATSSTLGVSKVRDQIRRHRRAAPRERRRSVRDASGAWSPSPSAERTVRLPEVLAERYRP